jgi:hypothetical protein
MARPKLHVYTIKYYDGGKCTVTRSASSVPGRSATGQIVADTNKIEGQICVRVGTDAVEKNTLTG